MFIALAIYSLLTIPVIISLIILINLVERHKDFLIEEIKWHEKERKEYKRFLESFVVDEELPNTKGVILKGNGIKSIQKFKDEYANKVHEEHMYDRKKEVAEKSLKEFKNKMYKRRVINNVRCFTNTKLILGTTTQEHRIEFINPVDNKSEFVSLYRTMDNNTMYIDLDFTKYDLYNLQFTNWVEQEIRIIIDKRIKNKEV